MIWDRVVTSAADARLSLTNAFNEYPIIDQHTELRGAPVSLGLHWDVMPITGLLYQGGHTVTRVRMPAQYCTEAECRPEPMPWPASPGAGDSAAGGST